MLQAGGGQADGRWVDVKLEDAELRLELGSIEGQVEHVLDIVDEASKVEQLVSVREGDQ